jgi:hypothetical protein
MTFVNRDSEFQESSEDFARAEFEERRKSLLEDYSLGDLIDLLPSERISDLRDEIIIEIIANNFDKQINDEVK